MLNKIEIKNTLLKMGCEDRLKRKIPPVVAKVMSALVDLADNDDNINREKAIQLFLEGRDEKEADTYVSSILHRFNDHMNCHDGPFRIDKREKNALEIHFRVVRNSAKYTIKAK